MVAEKKKRKDLEVPEFVKEQWSRGTTAREEMATALQEANWDKASSSHDPGISHIKYLTSN